MEEFINLNWSWKTNRLRSSTLYEANLFDDEKDVFLCHLNEIDHVHLLDNYGKDGSITENGFIRKDPRTGLVVSREVQDHSRHTQTSLFSNFLQQSSMNSNQHQSCLNALTKMKGPDSKISMSDRSDIRTFGQLFHERLKEKTEFLEFVKGEFFKRNIKNCQNLQPELNKFITKRWKDSIKKVVASNNNCYQLQSAIPLSLRNSTDAISIELKKTVDEFGIVLAVNRNNYTNQIQPSCSFLEYFFPNVTQAPTVPLEEFLLNESVDIVISLTTLASILCNTRDYSTDWNITFSLKKCNNKNVIIFDDIMPSSSLGCLEKNRNAYKYAVTAAIVVPKKKQIFSLKENCFSEREQLTLNEQHVSILSVEPASAFKVWQFDEYLHRFTTTPSTTNLNADVNHIRRLWKIQRNNVEVCRLVIDNSQDVCEKQSDGTVQFINLSPKIDYQCEFGAEQMSLSELITEWCELRFGPNTVTDRVRIDQTTGSILDATQITIVDVEADLQRLYQVRNESLLEPLFTFMKIMKQFPPNEYMLRHQRKHNAQAMVYVKSNDESLPNTIKIADIYESNHVDVSHLEIIPWNPIDDMICTTMHKRINVMPCAFPHWGKRQKPQPNDRLRIVQRAEQKRQEESDAILNRNALIKRKKSLKKRKIKKKILKIEKVEKLKFEGESLDPNELFDQQGNIQVNSLNNHDEMKNVPMEKNDSAEPICYESYCRDAAMASDDSVDSSDSSHTKGHPRQDRL